MSCRCACSRPRSARTGRAARCPPAPGRRCRRGPARRSRAWFPPARASGSTFGWRRPSGEFFTHPRGTGARPRTGGRIHAVAGARMKLARPLIVAVLTLAVVMSVPVAVAATNGTGLQQETAATAAAQDPAAVEASLGLDRPARRLIQQGLRNEGVARGTPAGLFGPRTRRDSGLAAVARSVGGFPAAPSSSRRRRERPTPFRRQPPSPPRIDSLNAAPTNAEQESRAATGSGNAHLPPEIMIDRHFVRAERLLAADDPAAALEALNEIHSGNWRYHTRFLAPNSGSPVPTDRRYAAIGFRVARVRRNANESIVDDHVGLGRRRSCGKRRIRTLLSSHGVSISTSLSTAKWALCRFL